MDMLMVDVTEINCTEIRYNFFWQPTVTHMAKKLNDTYEVLTSILNV
jgi:hypothetical protein